MKITIVQGAFLPVPTLLGGAVEKMWFILGQEFVRQGHEVVHISRKFKSLPNSEEIAGVRHLRVPGYSTPKRLTVLKALDLLYTLTVLPKLPQADILISNTFWLPMIPLARGKGALVVDVQRMPKGQMRFYRKAARLRANSTPVERAILANDPQAVGRTALIPNPLPFSFGEAIAVEPKQNVFLYAGRIHPEKGIELLLQAFSRVNAPGWKLRLAGPFETAQGGGGRAWWDALARQYAADSRIEWLGPLFGAGKLEKAYAEAAVFVYPSLAEQGETFGLAPLEAMAFGSVPVVSDLECFRDFIRPGSNGWTFNHRTNAVEELHAVLQRAVDAGELLAQLSQSAMAVRESHSVEKVAAMFLNDFSALIQGRVTSASTNRSSSNSSDE
jgi:glycosyltransferase involved in cell wall biosynthesis